MFCNKCGNKIEPNQQYCNKCGNLLLENRAKNTMEYNQYDSLNYNSFNKKNNIVLISIATIMVIIITIIVYVVIDGDSEDYYFDNNSLIGETEQTAPVQTATNVTQTKGKYKTAIITDNVYTGITINSIDDAKNLIKKDSESQKQADYSKEIIQIENDIIQKYSITAVNLKEMDVEFAKELENVIKEIYTNYPKARGHLTNLTLTNLELSESGVIALFMPVFTFGMSNTSTTRPWVIKTQVQLNAKYFLNPDRLESNIQTSSKSGHFPKNATKYSPVAHEFGHYLSFIALLNHYSSNSIIVVEDGQLQNFYNIYKDFGNCKFSKQMLEEAYQNYIKDNEKIDFDEWRGKISQYALAKDEKGDYIYDETVAEAFHDVYLNGENANIVSKYIVEVLKKYIEG